MGQCYCNEKVQAFVRQCDLETEPVLEEDTSAHLAVKQGLIVHKELVVHRSGNIFDDYDVANNKLGHGKFGTVSIATPKGDPQRRYAIKNISKRSGSRDRVLNEITLQASLDHPNIAKLFESYADFKCDYLVLELCDGGELFDRIVNMTFFSEAQAAIVMEQLFRAVMYMHSRQVCHRDLKPENMLLQNQNPIPQNNIKIIDFGVAAQVIPGKHFSTKAGSPFYIAPEVLARHYSQECDLWSCGVIMYVLLCGYPPFNGKNVNDTLAKVQLAQYQFQPKAWKTVSEQAKNLIRELLKANPRSRPTAEEALNNRWVYVKAPGAHSDEPCESVLNNLKSFRSAEKFKKAALHVIAWQMEDSKIAELRQAFVTADADKNGLLTAGEISACVSRAGFSSEELDALIDAMDTDNSGKVDYTEWLTATIERKDYQKECIIWSAFRVFDRNGDGKITENEVDKLLGNKELQNIVGESVVKTLLAEVDTNGDGNITFDEFMVMLKEKNC